RSEWPSPLKQSQRTTAAGAWPGPRRAARAFEPGAEVGRAAEGGREAPRRGPGRSSRLVAVVLGLVGSLLRQADVLRLLVGQLGQHRAQLAQLESRDLLVELLREDVDADRIVLGVGEELDLRQHLVRERRAHDVARVSGAA